MSAKPSKRAHRGLVAPCAMLTRSPLAKATTTCELLHHLQDLEGKDVDRYGRTHPPQLWLHCWLIGVGLLLAPFQPRSPVDMVMMIAPPLRHHQVQTHLSNTILDNHIGPSADKVMLA